MSRPHRAGRRPLLIALWVTLGLGGCTEASSSLANGYTSERERRHAKENPDYAERLRRAEGLAKQVDTDSLRTLYLRLLDSQPSERVALWHEVLCETSQQMIRYSPPVAVRAQQHLQDSLVALPGMAERWARSQQLPQHTMTTAGCDDNVPRAPEDLRNLPSPNVLR